MQKVAIVSCYFQPNYGSMLQALATQMVLDKLGFENETIDISGFKGEINKAKFKYFAKASVTSGILLTKLGRFKASIARRVIKNSYSSNIKIRNKKFDDFAREHFKLSEKFSSKMELGKKCSGKYSAIVVGSDQLWLPGNIAADYYTLNFVPDTINTIAYATSFGQASLPADSENAAKVFLKKIRHISVREKSGQVLIKKIVNRNVPVVCDPTLLFTAEEWLGIQKKEAIIDKPYIFCYFLGNNPLHRKFAYALKQKTGYDIVSLAHIDEYVKEDELYSDRTPFDIDPSDFLNLIRNASYVCTDSFHCTVFSVIYKRNFFTFKRFSQNNKQSTNSRLDTLFEITKIRDRFLEGNEDIDECIKTEIDFDKANESIKMLRNESYNYLINALKDERSTDL